jgi:hypothetical protein
MERAASQEENINLGVSLKEIKLNGLAPNAAPQANADAIAFEEADDVGDFSAATDAHGTVFDPDVHATDAEGRPKLTRKRTFALKRGRKGRADEAPVETAVTPENLTERVQAWNTGAGFASLLEAVGVAVGGGEFAYARDEKTGTDERAAMTHAFARFCEAKNINDIPPGIALTIAVVGYVAPRFAKPAVQSRFGGFKEWVAGKIAARRVRKMERGAVFAKGAQG